MLGKLNYPKTRKVTIEDDFFGTTVPDPYRWLEDASEAEVLAWTQEQMDFALEILGTMPGREKFKKRLTEVWNYPKYDVPEKFDDRLFFSENSGLLNQSIYYVKDGDRPQRVLIDPNTLSSDGTASLATTAPSPNGKLLAYSISFAGSDWREVRVRNVDTGRDAPRRAR